MPRNAHPKRATEDNSSRAEKNGTFSQKACPAGGWSNQGAQLARPATMRTKSSIASGTKPVTADAEAFILALQRAPDSSSTAVKASAPMAAPEKKSQLAMRAAKVRGAWPPKVPQVKAATPATTATRQARVRPRPRVCSASPRKRLMERPPDRK